MVMKSLRNTAFGFLLLAAACRTSQVPVQAQWEGYRITSGLSRDSSLLRLLAPYRDSVDRSMNEVVGFAEQALEKKQPEGTLGNFMVDAFFWAAAQKFGQQPDIGILNYGGIRLTQLPAGPVTRGKIFELMPFDNLLILQRVPGNTLQELLDLTAAKKGWPVANATYEIRNGKALNVRIGGKPLDYARTYVLVNSDYVANGGDNASMLQPLAQENRGYLMREALFDYIRHLAGQGKKISAKEENRVYVP